MLFRYAHRATLCPESETPELDAEVLITAAEPDVLGRVEASHAVVMRVADSEPVDADALSAFAEADGYFLAYPYVRQTLQQLADQVSLPPVVLPLLTRAVGEP